MHSSGGQARFPPCNTALRHYLLPPAISLASKRRLSLATTGLQIARSVVYHFLNRVELN